MTFKTEDKLKALAIVNIFETSRAFGDYSAVAVLDDGAGVSYGVSQFTHRSGSLLRVVERYLATDAQLGRKVIEEALPLLRRKSSGAISSLAANEVFKKALRAAAVTREMKSAQDEVATEFYLEPAIRFCASMSFTLPLSLAVVYDSINHGHFQDLAAHVHVDAERAWITEYVRIRQRWLSTKSHLKSTVYRTKFFLDQIATGNWDLKLPVNVQGLRLTEAMIPKSSQQESIAQPVTTSDVLQTAITKFDHADAVVTAVMTRTDRAKSLWTTVLGTFGQIVWAVFGFLAGLPREVWIVVAVIAAALTLLYLYRQIVMGRIREQKI